MRRPREGENRGEDKKDRKQEKGERELIKVLVSGWVCVGHILQSERTLVYFLIHRAFCSCTLPAPFRARSVSNACHMPLRA